MVDALITFVFLYLVIWWLILFMVLPVGIQRDESPEAGHDSGAPKNPKLKSKFINTSLITTLVCVLLTWLIETDVLALRTIYGE